MCAGPPPLDGEPERHDPALWIAGVVAVEVAVLPGRSVRGPLIEVDGGCRTHDRNAGPTRGEREERDGKSCKRRERRVPRLRNGSTGHVSLGDGCPHPRRPERGVE